MAVIRQGIWYSQQRVDVPHIRALESAVAGDFDLLAGRVIASGRAYVVKGFVVSGAVGIPADQLELDVSGGIILHAGASASGSMFSVPGDRRVEGLSRENGRVVGSWTASAKNLIGVDLRRSADSGTLDTVKFMDADTEGEFAKVVPTAQTLDYVIHIGTESFAFNPWLVPIAAVTLNGSGIVERVEDVRPMLFRIGGSGDSPGLSGRYPWSSRTLATGFAGGDKDIGSLKEWQDAVMTRLWELGGGASWYAATADRLTKVAYGTPYLDVGGTNVFLDTETDLLTWRSIKVLFSNSIATYNKVAEELDGVPFPDKSVLYVDARPNEQGAVIVPVVSSAQKVGLTGERTVIAWRIGDEIYLKDAQYESGRDVPVATPLSEGLVRLYQAATTPSSPIVLVDDQLNTTDPDDRIATVSGTGRLKVSETEGDLRVRGTLQVDTLVESLYGVFAHEVETSRVLPRKLLGPDPGPYTVGASDNHWDAGWIDELNAQAILPISGGSIGRPSDKWENGYFENLNVSGDLKSFSGFNYDTPKPKNIVVPASSATPESGSGWTLHVPKPSLGQLSPVSWSTETTGSPNALVFHLNPYLRTGMRLKTVTVYAKPNVARSGVERMCLGVYRTTYDAQTTTPSSLNLSAIAYDNGTTSSQRIVVSPDFLVNNETQEVVVVVTSGSTPENMPLEYVYALRLSVEDPGPRNY